MLFACIISALAINAADAANDATTKAHAIALLAEISRKPIVVSKRDLNQSDTSHIIESSAGYIRIPTLEGDRQIDYWCTIPRQVGIKAYPITDNTRNQ